MVFAVLNEAAIRTAIHNVFLNYGYGPFEIEAVINFAIREFDVTPFTYTRVQHLIRTYIITHCEHIEHNGITIIYYSDFTDSTLF